MNKHCKIRSYGGSVRLKFCDFEYFQDLIIKGKGEELMNSLEFPRKSIIESV